VKRSGFKRKPTKPLKRTSLRGVSKTSVSKLKKKLWELCREIVFKEHGNTCYTCGAGNLMGSNRHCGHFISKSVCSAEMAYDVVHLRPQCYRCNIHLSGNWVAFETHLKADGIDVEALKQRNYATKGMKADHHWYAAKIAEYQSLLVE